MKLPQNSEYKRMRLSPHRKKMCACKMKEKFDKSLCQRNCSVTRHALSAETIAQLVLLYLVIPQEPHNENVRNIQLQVWCVPYKLQGSSKQRFLSRHRIQYQKVTVDSRVIDNEFTEIVNWPYPEISHTRNEYKILSGFTRLTQYQVFGILR